MVEISIPIMLVLLYVLTPSLIQIRIFNFKNLNVSRMLNCYRLYLIFQLKAVTFYHLRTIEKAATFCVNVQMSLRQLCITA